MPAHILTPPTKELVLKLSTKHRRRSVLGILLFGVAFALAIVIVYFDLLEQTKFMKVPYEAPCGDTSSEAQRKGCHFDTMAFSWVPPACYDGELEKEFLSKKDWVWFLEENNNITISPEVVQTGDINVAWVTWEYHQTHCTYMWRKMHRAVAASTPLDGYIRDYHHTAHCEVMLLQDVTDNRKQRESIYIKYPNCGGPDVGHLGWFRVINGKRYHRDP
ncbi:hypothetical protein BT63DRAFT_418727 [Microthyrium microscopicum]|uniref:Uncharacterized protein n=1 Tax=Microthyrium microscopicum TaxID=703497 RepID=A0A6A6TWX2_9PEZI|nr:hypothetical protein BT63DRAFT_418727 [Microthyrium microscopicum]